MFIGEDALPLADEGGSLKTEIEAIGSAEETTGGEGPSVSIVTSLFEAFDGDILVTDVEIDEGDGSDLSGKLVVMEFIVFGIGQIDLCLWVIHGESFFDGDELVTFFGVARDG